MKKFLVLSFLMLLFTCAISFAQTRTVYHYKSNPTASVYISSYEVRQPVPWDPSLHYGGMTISPWSTGDINYTNAYVYVKYLDGGYYEHYRTVYNGDGAFEDLLFDPSKVEYAFWSFELSCNNGDTEIYDITDVYN